MLLSCLSEGTGSPERGLDARRTRDWNEAGDTMFDLYLLLVFSSCTINVSRRGYLGACHLILPLSWAFPSHTGLGVRLLATKRTRHGRETGVNFLDVVYIDYTMASFADVKTIDRSRNYIKGHLLSIFS